MPSSDIVALPQRRLDSVTRGSEVIVIFEGATPGTSAFPHATGLDGFRLYFDHFFLESNVAGADMDVSIDGGTNVDASEYQDIIWRHNRSEPGGEGFANAAYVDGHASASQYNSQNDTDIKRRNVVVNE
jgi:prepilin-type processing-associated H-X9-DG protein